MTDNSGNNEASRTVSFNLDELARVLSYQSYAGSEPEDGAIILVDEAAAYVRTDQAGRPVPTGEYDDYARSGDWYLLDGVDDERHTALPGGNGPVSLGEILGYDEVPEDRKPHTYEQLYSADDVLRLVAQVAGLSEATGAAAR